MSNNRHTTYRALHDVGLAAWFGGSLFGAAGLNAAAAEAPDVRTAERVSSIGWAKWSPVNTAAIATHAVGALGLLAANRRRVRHQPGPAANTAVKAGLTVAAGAATVYARLLGKKIEQEVVHRSNEVSSSAASPVVPTGQDGPSTAVGEADKQIGRTVGAVADALPADLASAHRQLRAAQFVVPALTGAALVLGAQHGEQQRPSEQLREGARRVLTSS